MGRALECPLCRSADIRVEEVVYQRDLWSRFPSLTTDTMLALCCKNCRHVRVIQPVPERLHERLLIRN